MPGDDDKKRDDEPGDGTVRDILGYLEDNPDPEARRLARTLLKDRFRMVQEEIELVRQRRHATGPEEREAIDRKLEEQLGARVTRAKRERDEDSES